MDDILPLTPDNITATGGQGIDGDGRIDVMKGQSNRTNHRLKKAFTEPSPVSTPLSVKNVAKTTLLLDKQTNAHNNLTIPVNITEQQSFQVPTRHPNTNIKMLEWSITITEPIVFYRRF